MSQSSAVEGGGLSRRLAGATALGNRVEMIIPEARLGSSLVERYLFNYGLRLRRQWNFDAIIGFDLDGFALPRKQRIPHIANIKGVLADALPFERGNARAVMALQSRWEAEHARRADLVITISEYCKQRLQELYGLRGSVAVVPEMIDLVSWRRLFRENPATKPADEFTVLRVCRFYPRKRLKLLLRAAHWLRRRIPELRIRVVGGGPEAPALRQLWRELKLESIVSWLGELPRHELAREYNCADIFCLPGKPIVAARAAAVPEVVKHGLLVDPEDFEALADGILRLWRDPALRDTIRRQQSQDVEQYGMVPVTTQFLHEVGRVVRTE